MKNVIAFTFILSLVISGSLFAQTTDGADEIYRPQIHFSPKAHWINDPNGMVYHKGVYHLFFQYFPDGNIWGPMHWGHATSKDLFHWEEKAIALYPDSLGYIFSGSAVVDENNTAGFAKNGEVPLVAIFTHHSMEGEKAKRNDFQNQSLAYSLDDGTTWVKYSGNPVLRNPGITDFRDPKVMWFEGSKKWIMTLATKDRITFYSSPNLKDWTRESEFGENLGAHGGVWECPDLFTLDDNGKKVWVLLVNINPGGPNGGSATQYFLGDFDGKTFTAQNTGTKWLDYGPDEYAGITWSNTGNRKIFLGWMSNWQYANVVPTETWRNAMTIARELKLKRAGNDLLIASEPVKEIENLQESKNSMADFSFSGDAKIDQKISSIKFPFSLDISLSEAKDFSIELSNDLNEKLLIGYNGSKNQYFIDRTKSGKVAFEKGFAGIHVAPRFSKDKELNLHLIFDNSSVELFGDDGLSVMTEIFFPNKPYDKLSLTSKEKIHVKQLEYTQLAKSMDIK
ncbi:MAG: glycoside hydrolase family 32 protein [Daejeonella sp.]